jgi:hypothetical protein
MEISVQPSTRHTETMSTQGVPSITNKAYFPTAQDSNHTCTAALLYLVINVSL